MAETFLTIAENRQPRAVFTANSFVLPESGLKSFVMPDVHGHYPVSSCNCNKQGGGGGLSIGKLQPSRIRLRTIGFYWKNSVICGAASAPLGVLGTPSAFIVSDSKLR
jgi:hypothetical protein